MTNLFIWVAHPRKESFCKALADAYEDGARTAGVGISRQDLSNMQFSTAFEGYRAGQNELEPDLLAWQDNISGADHLLFVFPYWWAAMPARGKAVLDRALLPGFAFKYHDSGLGWDKLLKGKTGDAIITSDTPPWYDTLMFRKPSRNIIRNQVYGFCGIKSRKIVQMGSVKTATPERREKWLDQARALGASLS
ncbi:Putative NADPH-quinone reductase (modulator of drug activity B) [Parasphingorhabdus marina DSM 22363]|uniref:Putative NADPH-quinone reductase (Modulator of drug activity B) n=1 Tax=Parasphingorhabdus marina DSM 22363 TaxID=1123272 RepID=A0A1N6EH08_9SPHN|nr:NAD(P)H-dependent oxidoreductase [Parasphingorhabdus marina]SIN82177.1 Putative NADPH-quinone reductase (modulator of drug activity B) [Parasphingorhabdus marina DSM 22363]